MARKRTRREIREERAAWLFLFPNLAGFIAFTIGPLLYSIRLSFYEWSVLFPARFVGVNNYVQMLQDPYLWQSLWNTVYYVLGVVPTGVILAFILALALNNIQFRTMFRTVYFMPVVSSTVAVSFVWLWVYQPTFGLLNGFLRYFGLPEPGWLADAHWAMPAVIIMSIWKGLGINMVLYLAALQGIPRHLYEAARIDGATKWQEIWHITIPMVSPTTLFILIMSIIGSFQVFDQAYIMTRGGPAGATTTIVYYIYKNAFEFFRLGYASSLAWSLFAIILVFTILQWVSAKGWVFYGGSE